MNALSILLSMLMEISFVFLVYKVVVFADKEEVGKGSLLGLFFFLLLHVILCVTCLVFLFKSGNTRLLSIMAIIEGLQVLVPTILVFLAESPLSLILSSKEELTSHTYLNIAIKELYVFRYTHFISISVCVTYLISTKKIIDLVVFIIFEVVLMYLIASSNVYKNIKPFC